MLSLQTNLFLRSLSPNLLSPCFSLTPPSLSSPSTLSRLLVPLKSSFNPVSFVSSLQALMIFSHEVCHPVIFMLLLHSSLSATLYSQTLPSQYLKNLPVQRPRPSTTSFSPPQAQARFPGICSFPHSFQVFVSLRFSFGSLQILYDCGTCPKHLPTQSRHPIRLPPSPPSLLSSSVPLPPPPLPSSVAASFSIYESRLLRGAEVCVGLTVAGGL